MGGWKTREQGRAYMQKYRQSHLTACRANNRRAYYKHRKEILAKMAIAYRQEREWFNALKARPCMDCGGSFPPCVMQFDHVRGEKKFVVGTKLGKQHTRKYLLAEMAKCDLVCANCHAIRTWIVRKHRGNTQKPVPVGLFPGEKEREY